MSSLRLLMMETLQMTVLATFYGLDIALNIIVFLYSMASGISYRFFIAMTGSDEGELVEHPQCIVIIGYSFAGFELHKLLQSERSLKHYQFVVIEPKTYFEFTPSVLSTMLNPSKYKSISFPLSDCFDTARSILIQGNATKIDRKRNKVSIRYKNGNTKQIRFDYCFICTGSKYVAPIKVNTEHKLNKNVFYKERAKQFEAIYSRLSGSNEHQSVAIIGGGPVGVELTAEIAEHFPNKRVTLIHRNDCLCRLFPESTQKYLENYMTSKKNVTLRLSTKLRRIETLNKEGRRKGERIIDGIVSHSQW